jgi:hypothetical protein
MTEVNIKFLHTVEVWGPDLHKASHKGQMKRTDGEEVDERLTNRYTAVPDTLSPETTLSPAQMLKGTRKSRLQPEPT